MFKHQLSVYILKIHFIFSEKRNPLLFQIASHHIQSIVTSGPPAVVGAATNDKRRAQIMAMVESLPNKVNSRVNLIVTL